MVCAIYMTTLTYIMIVMNIGNNSAKKLRVIPSFRTELSHSVLQVLDFQRCLLKILTIDPK